MIPLIEIGVVVTAGPEPAPLVIPDRAINDLKHHLTRWLPELSWRIQVVTRATHFVQRNQSGSVEPTALLGMAADLRDHFHWDFVLVLTNATLISRYRRDAMAALSRPLDAAVISVASLSGSAEAFQVNASDNISGEVHGNQARSDHLHDTVLADRITTLMLHALGHLGGLPARKDREGILNHPVEVGELDGMNNFTPTELQTLRATFEAVADTRLEEQKNTSRSPWRFALKAMIINRQEIYDAVLAARAWEFPRRLSRLTTAAVSTLAILILTAEVWDLALDQSWQSTTALALMALLLTTLFVVSKQQLIRRHARATEQLVVTQVSALLTVMLGLITTWVGALLLATLASSFLFSPELIASWAMADTNVISENVFKTHLAMSAFCASIALLIGSLGASFEEQHHFQHVIFVDVEL